MSDAPLRIGIVSLAHGHAYSYARVLKSAPRAELIGIWDDDLVRGKEASIRFGVVFFDSLEDLLARCDGVIIAAENALHHDLVIAAAAGGVHVLCEKPLATSAAAALVMNQACAAAGVTLATAFPIRYSPAVRQLREVVRSGALGQTLMIRTTNRGTYPGNWFGDLALAGGGALTDHVVHVADLLRWIWGTEFRSVYAEAATRYFDLQVEDCGLLLITLADDTVVSLDPSWSRPEQAFPTWGDLTLEVTGTLGQMSVDVFGQHVELYSNTQVRARYVPWGDDLDGLMIRDWLVALRQGYAPPITGEDGLRAVELVEAAYESARNQRPMMVQQQHL